MIGMPETDGAPIRLMISGRIGDAEVQRGMPVIDESGVEIGHIAGVAVGRDNERVTALLLGSVPPSGDYRLIPVVYVKSVVLGQVHLHLRSAGLNKLPLYE